MLEQMNIQQKLMSLGPNVRFRNDFKAILSIPLKKWRKYRKWMGRSNSKLKEINKNDYEKHRKEIKHKWAMLKRPVNVWPSFWEKIMGTLNKTTTPKQNTIWSHNGENSKSFRIYYTSPGNSSRMRTKRPPLSWHVHQSQTSDSSRKFWKKRENE